MRATSRLFYSIEISAQRRRLGLHIIYLGMKMIGGRYAQEPSSATGALRSSMGMPSCVQFIFGQEEIL